MGGSISVSLTHFSTMDSRCAKVVTIGMSISILKAIKQRKYKILVNIKKLAIFQVVGILVGKTFYGEVFIK